jgi:hypothetical protein
VDTHAAVDLDERGATAGERLHVTESLSDAGHRASWNGTGGLVRGALASEPPVAER